MLHAPELYGIRVSWFGCHHLINFPFQQKEGPVRKGLLRLSAEALFTGITMRILNFADASKAWHFYLAIKRKGMEEKYLPVRKG